MVIRTIVRLARTAALGALIGLAAEGPAFAQADCSGLSALQCAQAGQQYQLLQTFQALPSSPAGMAVMNADMATVQNIYLNATAVQQNQAATNSNLTGGAPQQNTWGMLSALIAGSPPTPNPFYQTLSVFPQLPAAQALVAAIQPNLAGTSPAITKVNNLIGSMVGSGGSWQITPLKDSFTAYAQAFAGQSTIYAFPSQIDPRPFQISNIIAGAAWTSTPGGITAASVAAQQGEWGAPGSGGDLQTSGAFPSGHTAIGDTTALAFALFLPQAYQSLMVSAQQFGLSRNIMGAHHTLDVIGSRVVTYFTMTQALAGATNFNSIPNLPSYIQQGIQEFATLLGSAATAAPYATCAGAGVATCIANGTIPTAASFNTANQAYALQATYGLPSIGPTNAAPVVPQNAELLLTTRFPYLSPSQIRNVLASTELPSGGPLDDGSGWVRLNLFAAAGGYGAFTAPTTVTMDAALGGFNAIDVWSNNISGPGGLTLLGSGTLVLAGNNTFTGGTTVGCATGIGCATLALSGTMTGSLSVQPGATFVTGGGYVVSPSSTLNNAGTVRSVNIALLNQGTLVNTGTMLGDLLNSGSVTNNGTITGNVASSGWVGGSGTIVGNLLNGGIVAPGNSIGTLTVTGNYTQSAGGTFAPEVAANGQSDLLSIGGTASLGGAVAVVTQPGTGYAPRTTYRILTATGGLGGTSFGSIANNYPFLQPSLSYDANNAYLTLQMGGFAAAAATPMQAAVGGVIDANVNTATGDFAQVLSAIATNVQSPAAAQYVLQTLSGNNYAGFASTAVQGAQTFMNNFAGQAGGGAPTGSRVALAEACEVACDGTSPARWGAWGGAIGGLGTIGANAAVGAVTYNAGGFAAGLDRQLADTIRLGVTAGYSAGNQWVSGFAGQGSTSTFNIGLYGNYAEGPAYVDALAGYAYSANQMWRPISLPGLATRTALGQAGVNQWYGQLEAGWRFDIGTAANAWLTPFARLQAYTGTQNAFTETGAQSLNLSVAQQTTNSLRSVLGAQLGGGIDLGWREKLALTLRAGWSHEYADVSRPVTAALAGAPAMPFTTFGISPTRDGALLGLAASTAIADATSVYLRYEGTLSGPDNAHAFTAGLRMTW